MWSSHISLEPPQQPPPAQQQDVDFHSSFHSPAPQSQSQQQSQPPAQQQSQHHAQSQQSQPLAIPSTPQHHHHHHRRGQSMSAVNAPRTPNNPSLRPPVYLQSPMAAATHQSGLLGVGDMFSPHSGSFHDNMGYYSPVMSSPGTALDNLNEEIANFDLGGFGGPLAGDGLFDSPAPSPGQGGFAFHNHNPFTSPPESFIPPRTASPQYPLASTPVHLDPYIRTPQSSPTRHPLRDSFVATPGESPTHTNPLKESLLLARQPSPSRDFFEGSLIRTPEPSPTRGSFSHPNPMQTAPDLRPSMTPRGSVSPSRSRQSPSPSRRMRAHQRTQSLASISSVMSLADGDMEQYRVESNVKPEQISELIGETETTVAASDAAIPDATAPSAGSDGSNKKFICKWIEASKDTGEEKQCGQFFERKENCKAHIQTHLDDRQYKCPYTFCSKLFVRSHDLRRHLRTHDVHKKWVCPCGRDFSRADALHRHQGRGNCIGAPPGTKRKEPAKRGRPPKKKDVVPNEAGVTTSSPNESGSVQTLPPPSAIALDLSQPPQPDLLPANSHNGATFAPMGMASSGGDYPAPDHYHRRMTSDDEDMTGMGVDLGMEMPDFGCPSEPSPGDSPTRSGASPLEDELASSSPLPGCGGAVVGPADDDALLGAPAGDEWLEDLIFINDENFADDVVGGV